MINAKKPTSIEQVRRSSIHKLLMYVCMYVFIAIAGILSFVPVSTCMYVRMNEYMYVMLHACMYVYICMNTLLTTIV
jgi:hypothetical protein